MNANMYARLAAHGPLGSHAAPDSRAACAIETAAGPGWSWADLDRASARVARWLASLGLPAGARVAVQVPKTPEAVALYLGTLRAGLVYVPLNDGYRAGEIAYFLGDAEPSVFACAPDALAWAEPLAAQAGVPHVVTLGADGRGTLADAAGLAAPADAARGESFEPIGRTDDDLAVILYTSGTTGRSKGAMLTHRNLWSNCDTLQHAWRWRPDDVLLHALPIFHIHGLFVAIHGALRAGARMIFLPRFDAADVARRLPRATVFMGVPTMYVRLLAEPAFDRAACAGMRLFVSGSAPLLADTFRAFEARTGQRILERYGMSETVMLTSNPYDGPRKPGTVGPPLPGVDVRIDGAGDDGIGAIQVRGPNVFAGYWRMPEKTREEFTADGWFRTGDMGCFDADGWLSIVGRSKDLIITGGYNVYPKEIEGWLDELSGVAESAVVGVPHPDFGEAVVAVVVPRAGAALDEAALIAALKTRIAGFKVPKRVHVVDELPRNTMGKVQKNLLRERFGG